jgi:hypothetical protein
MKGSGRRERSFDTAESETLGMWGNSMRENREALQTPALASLLSSIALPYPCCVSLKIFTVSSSGSTTRYS